MNMQPTLRFIAVCWLALTATFAQAQLAVEITGSSASQFPVSIPLLENEGQLNEGVTDIVRDDLERSGLFRIVDTGLQTFPVSETPDMLAMRALGADALLSGTVTPLGDGRHNIQIRLFDTIRHTELGALALAMSEGQHRLIGHMIADFIYEKLTGEPGYFATRIAYVATNGSRHELQVSDADGHNPQTALVSSEPIISPAWSPDGRKLAYVSFEQKKPVIYSHDLASGQRTQVSNHFGSNSAPSWAPDGQKLAIVLTRDGPSQIYVVNADGSGLKRLSNSRSIDTEPVWSPDGQSIYFTSDRGGSPQIYRMPASGGQAQRVTFDGTYNVTPRISADGKTLAYVTRHNGRFQVATMDLISGTSIVLTDEAGVESPSFAPNGRMILYASGGSGRSSLSAISADGRVRQTLSSQTAGQIREPAWGPLPRN